MSWEIMLQERFTLYTAWSVKSPHDSRAAGAEAKAESRKSEEISGWTTESFSEGLRCIVMHFSFTCNLKLK